MLLRLLSPLVLATSWLATFFALPAAGQWTRQNSGLAANSGIASISIVDANTVWAAGYNGPAPATAYNAYTRTTTAGTSWTTGTIAAASSYLLTTLSAASASVAWAACNGPSGGGYLYYTSDAGTTWTRQLSSGFPAASGGYLNGVLAFSPTQAVAAGDPLTTTSTFELYTTSNAGTTWTAATTAPTRLSGETGVAGTLTTVVGSTAAATARPVWLGTTAGRVLRSTDSGTTWTAGATGLAQVTALAFCSASTGLALNADDPSTLAYTTDGGASWSTRTPSGTFYTTGLAGVPGLSNGFVSTGNDNNGSGSAYSLDGGTTWTSLDAGVAHTSVAFLSSSVGWSGGFATSATVGGIYFGTLPVTTLPVTLVAFNAQASGPHTGLLTWTTANERSNDHFVIERSLDGQQFAAIGQVQGNGTTQSSHSYSYTDAAAPAAATLVYYRLQQVDADGTATYSPVRVVQYSATDGNALPALFPNPVVTSTTLDLSAWPAETYQAALIQCNGQVQARFAVPGGQLNTLDLHALAAGQYLLQLTSKTQGSTTIRLLKQ